MFCSGGDLYGMASDYPTRGPIARYMAAPKCVELVELTVTVPGDISRLRGKRGASPVEADKI